MGGDAQLGVFLADDNLILREGVCARISAEPDLDVVGVAGDHDELVEGASAARPDVVVTDIRIPPNFQNEGIEAAKLVRKRHPGTGIVVLSQFDDPEYAIALVAEGAAGFAYLLNDRVGDGDRLARAIRTVATGGSMLDPGIVAAMINPVRSPGALADEDEDLLRQVAEGRPVKAIAATLKTTPEAVDDAVEAVFLQLARDASAGQESARRRLRLLRVQHRDVGGPHRLHPPGPGRMRSVRRHARERAPQSGVGVSYRTRTDPVPGGRRMTDFIDSAEPSATAVAEAVLTVRGVRRTFEADLAPVRAVRGVDLTIGGGEYVAIVGPSGCGKSTLLNMIAGLEPADEGEIVIYGETITGRDENWLALMRRRRIGFVFQFFNLIDDMSALENVVLAMMIAGRKRKPAESRARDLIDLLGLGDKADQYPAELSGGQRQRLAIARALANEPTLVLADEPTGALDSDGGREIVELFRRLHGDGQTIIVVTHSTEVAAGADRIVEMRDGRIPAA